MYFRKKNENTQSSRKTKVLQIVFNRKYITIKFKCIKTFYNLGKLKKKII